MSVSYWQDSVGTSVDLETDVTIIGAGLAGLSTAFWLAKLDPQLRIIVIDRGSIGSGASGRNAGFITCGSTEHFSRMSSAYGKNKAADIWNFTEYNHRLLVEEFGEKKLEKKCEYRNLGSWTLASTDHESRVIKDTVLDLRAMGVKVGWFDDAAVKRRLSCEGFQGGAFYQNDGEIHPLKYLWYLSSRLGRKTKILENHEVFNFDYRKGNLIVRANRRKIKSEAVVLCTNAWSEHLHPWFQDKIAPTRGQIIVTEPVPQFLEPCYCSFVLDYFRQLVDGRVLIGGFRNVDVEKEVGFSDEINPKINEKLEEFLHQHFPLLRGKKIDYRWSGVMGFAADGYPMIGALDSDPQIFYNVGFTAHGLGFTFATGQLTAELLLNGKDPGIFSGRRFA